MSPFEELRNGETLGFKKAQDIGLPRINKKLYGLDEIFVSRMRMALIRYLVYMYCFGF